LLLWHKTPRCSVRPLLGDGILALWNLLSQQPDSMILAIVTQPLVDVIEIYDQSIRIVAKVLIEGESKELLRRFVRETREGKIGERSDNLC